MFEFVYDTSKSEEENHHIFLNKYSNIMKEITEDLDFCKINQNDIRTQLQDLSIENKNSNKMLYNQISRMFFEEGCDEKVQNELIKNLQQQITILQIEKNYAFETAQDLAQNINSLEQILKTEQKNSKDIYLYEDQLEMVKESYSKVIKVLEDKLFKTKDDFTKQHSLCIKTKESEEILKQEKQEIENKFQNLQQTIQHKDKRNHNIVQSLTEDLSAAKAEIQKLKHLNSSLEKKVNESKKVVDNITAKNEEAKCKMAEALEIIECAITEKNVVLERETKLTEQNAKLVAQLASITKENSIKNQEEITKLKDAHEFNVKKYLIEIKELKSQLREKVTLLEQLHMENKAITTVLENERQSTADLLGKSAATILGRINFDEPKAVDSKTCKETCKSLNISEIQQLQKKITNLEENLAISNDKLKQYEQISINVQDNIVLAEERATDAINRYVHLEGQLIKATKEKESLITKLKSLESTYDNEIRERVDQQRMLENKIHELEMSLQKENYTRENKLDTNIYPAQVSSQHCATTINKDTLDINIENIGNKWQSLLTEKMKEQQEYFNKKMGKMAHYVTYYQELSRNWTFETKFLTKKFEIKCKELHKQISTLKKTNAELENKILILNQENTTFKSNASHRFTGFETR